jgi:hypothetical protein
MSKLLEPSVLGSPIRFSAKRVIGNDSKIKNKITEELISNFMGNPVLGLKKYFKLI